MIMVLFPCPPLPMLASRLDGAPAVMSSHDLMAKLMDEAARRGDERGNERRKEVQEALTKAYTERLGLEADPWDCMCAFTRAYLDSYFPGAIRDVRIVPCDATPTHIEHRVREWVAAREILGGKQQARALDHCAAGALLYRKARAVVLQNPLSVFNPDV